MPSDTTSPLPALQYAVFLSYRHADNIDPGRQWASWLHVSLETYEVPPDLVGTPNALGEPIAASLYPVFRDEEELPAGADLTNEIRQALERSRTLVVLCSPRAVGSRFVADEIRYFKELGKSAHLLALMIDGEPNVTDDPGKHAAGIPASTECLPEPLRFGVPRDDGSVDWAARAQPVCADVRPEGRPVQGWTTAAACRESLEREGTHAPDAIAARVQDYERRLEIAKLKIVAGALGVPLGELTKRDAAFQLEKERRRRKITAFIASVVLVLGLLAVWQWRVAIDQRHEADIQKADAVDARGRAEALAKSEAQQRGLADEQRGLAEAQRIATETANATLKDQLHEASRSDHVAAETHFRDNRWHQGVAYLGRSVRYDPDNLASLNHLWTALLYGQGNREGRMVSAMPFPVERFVSVPPPRFFANGSRVLAANLKNDDVQRWTPDGTPIGKRISWKERALHAAALTTDEKTIVTLSGTKFDKPEIVERWDAETGEAAGSHVELPSPAQWKAGPLSPDGRFVALRFENQPKGKFVFKAADSSRKRLRRCPSVFRFLTGSGETLSSTKPWRRTLVQICSSFQAARGS